MSWHFHNGGTKNEVKAAIDEAVSKPGNMPQPIGAYLKNAVDAVDLTEGAADGVDRYFVVVESSGHRPMSGSGARETCSVTKVRRGPWDAAPGRTG